MEELEQEELDKDLLGVGTSTHELPEVPTAEIKEPAAAKEKKKGITLNILKISWYYSGLILEEVILGIMHILSTYLTIILIIYFQYQLNQQKMRMI